MINGSILGRGVLEGGHENEGRLKFRDCGVFRRVVCGSALGLRGQRAQTGQSSRRDRQDPRYTDDADATNAEDSTVLYSMLSMVGVLETQQADLAW